MKRAGLMVMLLACSAPPAREAAPFGIDRATCVLSHAQDPPLNIVGACGVDYDSVSALLEAARRYPASTCKCVEESE
jgi:hypothetical protein